MSGGEAIMDSVWTNYPDYSSERVPRRVTMKGSFLLKLRSKGSFSCLKKNNSINYNNKNVIYICIYQIRHFSKKKKIVWGGTY